MARTYRACFTTMRLLLMLLIHICHVSAAPLTYDGCMSDSTNSYRVGGWCFLIYRNPSWPNNTPLQDAAQTVCHPYGTLAVGVTYKMMQTLINGTTIWGAATDAILPLTRNVSYPTPYQGAGIGSIGWYWSVLLPKGDYATFPAIMSNIPWGPGAGANPAEPNNQLGNEKIASMVKNYGVCDAQDTYSIPSYGARAMGVICQFAPPQWSYRKRGNGRFADPAFRIAQMTVPKLLCVHECHRSLFCISLAYNPTTSDCQIYAVSPEDTKFVGDVTPDSAYDWHIRDGMEY
uniref:Apple domain-containing protein n=1 Tax=Plectus sambesii TaxID=2011161 RepID=A0A914W0V2_9BILA